VTHEESEARLRELLAAAGVSGARDSSWENPLPATAEDVQRVIATWERFAPEPVDSPLLDPEGEAMLASYGTWEFRPGDKNFEVTIERRFYVLWEDGEFDHVALLRTTFLYDPVHDELGVFEADSFETPLDVFFEQVRAAPGFNLDVAPRAIRVYYNEV
jgi:hypothetical protein